MAGQLIVSISGIRDRTLDDVIAFRDQLADRGVPASLLVAPRLDSGYRIDHDARTVDWLTARRRHGDAIVLHGFDGAGKSLAHEAGLRLTAADRILDHLGLRTRLFAAPRWITSPGTFTALRHNGFRLSAGLHEIVDLVRGDAVRARVLGIGEGFLTEPWWCRAVVLSAERTARRRGVVRVAVAARHLRRPGPRQAMLDAVDLALMHSCVPAVYQWTPRPALTRAA